MLFLFLSPDLGLATAAAADDPLSRALSTPRGHMAITPAMTAQTVSVVADDLNPLKPCGTCTEWLKKIAEVNPAFKVLSFTDADCTGFYCESIFDV